VIAESVDWQDPSLPTAITDHMGAGAFFTSAWAGFPDLMFLPVGDPLADTARGRVAQEWRMVGTHTGFGFPPGVPATGRAFDVTGTTSGRSTTPVEHCRCMAYWNVATLLAQLGLA